MTTMKSYWKRILDGTLTMTAFPPLKMGMKHMLGAFSSLVSILLRRLFSLLQHLEERSIICIVLRFNVWANYAQKITILRSAQASVRRFRIRPACLESFLITTLELILD